MAFAETAPLTYHSVMRCKHCDYLLFNLTRSECPECGRGFDTEEYRFAPGAVSFHCPHCDQAYFGNDERGLPMPRAFVCAGCGNPVSLKVLRVVPETDDAMGWIGSAWDNRKFHGLWSAWWRTFKQTLLRPNSFYREHVGRSTREAWLFSVIALYIGVVPMMFFEFLITWGISAGVGKGTFSMPGAPPIPAMPSVPIALLAVMFVFIALVLPLFTQMITGGFLTLTTQFALYLLVPQRKSMGATFRVALYSFGVYAINCVPLCGGWVAGVWQIVTLINGVKTVHGTSGWRASIAVLWPIVILMGLYMLVVIAIVGSALAS